MITVLTGDNSYLIAQQVARLTAEFDGQAERIEGEDFTLERLPDLLMGASLFASQRLIIVRQPSASKVIFNQLEDWLGKVPDETHLVLIEPQIDKRTRTYKWLKKNATLTEHQPLKDRQLQDWLIAEAQQQVVSLTRELATQIINRVGTDQWELFHAVQKLALYGKPISGETINQLVEATPQANAFELLDAVIARDSSKTFRLLEDIKQTEDAYRFMGLLGSQLVTLAACVHSEGKPAASIAKDVGAHPFVVSKLLQAARRIDKRELTVMVEALAEADRQLKSTGAAPWTIIGNALGKITAKNS